jgi:hypothetical protein
MAPDDRRQRLKDFNRSNSFRLICWSSKAAFGLPVLGDASASVPGALSLTAIGFFCRIGLQSFK